MIVERSTITMDWFPDHYTFDSVEQMLNYVRTKGNSFTYSIVIYCKRGDKSISFRILRLTNIHGQEILSVHFSDVESDKELNSVMTFLGLEAENSVETELEKTAFIAYRFDETGENLCLKLSRFLELIGFSVKSGRAYSPKKVSQKVEENISNQSVFFVILTKGSDNTWLTQEPTLAKAREKPVFILKESDYQYNSGIFADQEFIPFQITNFEKTFIPILEGLREIGLVNQG